MTHTQDVGAVSDAQEPVTMTTPISVPLDVRRLKATLGSFMTGVTIATTVDAAGVRYGFTANSFTSVSLDPPLVLICLGNRSRSFDAFQIAPGFAVNILAAEQRAMANRFASSTEVDRFGDGDWRNGPAGNPVLSGVAGWLDCRTHDRVMAGDHLVLIGEVVGFDAASDVAPLGYLRGAYLDPE